MLRLGQIYDIIKQIPYDFSVATCSGSMCTANFIKQVLFYFIHPKRPSIGNKQHIVLLSVSCYNISEVLKNSKMLSLWLHVGIKIATIGTPYESGDTSLLIRLGKGLSHPYIVDRKIYTSDNSVSSNVFPMDQKYKARITADVSLNPVRRTLSFTSVSIHRLNF